MYRNNGVQVSYKKEDDGLITRAGASWEEERPHAQSFLLSCVVASVFTLLVGLFVHPLLAFGLVGLVASIGMLMVMRGPERALYFDDEGQIHAPHNTADGVGTHIRWHADEVVSIEARMQHPQPKIEDGERMFEVILLSDGGELITVSRNLSEQTALKVAAQLTKALSKLRAEHGASGGFSGAWGAAG